MKIYCPVHGTALTMTEFSECGYDYVEEEYSCPKEHKYSVVMHHAMERDSRLFEFSFTPIE